MRKRITIIDLNNFAFYPTQPIGIISSILRDAGYQVDLISPLNTDVVSKPREGQEGKKDYWMSRAPNVRENACSKRAGWSNENSLSV